MAEEKNHATWAKRMNYKNGYNVFVGDHVCEFSPEGAAFRVHTDPWNENHNYMRVEFNPSKVPSFFIREHLNILLKDGYSRLMTDGKVTVWHEAIDIHFCELKDLYLYYPKFQCSTVNYKGGNTISTYLGKTTGSKFFCIYDKSQEIKDTNANFYHDYMNVVFEKEPIPEYPIMRVELRQDFKKQTIPVEGTKGLPNYFPELKIFNRIIPENQSMFKKKNDEMVFRLFLDCCNSKGLQQARLQLTPDWRKKIDPIMAKTKVEWWNPDKAAEQRELAINRILSPKTMPKQYEKDFKALAWLCNHLH